jgi:hypothetical protein
MARLGTFLVPTGEERAPSTGVRQLPAVLSGRHVGFLDNRKANFHLLADLLSETLRAEYGVGAVTVRQKANSSVPASAEVLAELAKTCDVVFAGSGD